MTLAERLIKTGIEQGRKQGHTQGAADVLLRQLEAKFSILDDDLRQRVRTASDDQLDTWTLRVLSATSLDDVFAE